MKVKVGVSVILSYRELNLLSFIVFPKSQFSCWIFGLLQIQICFMKFMIRVMVFQLLT